MVFAKNASFRSYGVICLPQMPPITLKPPKDGYQRNQRVVGKTLIFTILTKNASFRSYGTFAYHIMLPVCHFVLRAHIRNINMHMYITSARGHELSGRVRTHAYNYMPGLNPRG